MTAAHDRDSPITASVGPVARRSRYGHGDQRTGKKNKPGREHPGPVELGNLERNQDLHRQVGQQRQHAHPAGPREARHANCTWWGQLGAWRGGWVVRGCEGARCADEHGHHQDGGRPEQRTPPGNLAQHTAHDWPRGLRRAGASREETECRAATPSLENPRDRHRRQRGDDRAPGALDATSDDQPIHRGSCRRRNRAHGEHNQSQREHPAETDPVHSVLECAQALAHVDAPVLCAFAGISAPMSVMKLPMSVC